MNETQQLNMAYSSSNVTQHFVAIFL